MVKPLISGYPTGGTKIQWLWLAGSLGCGTARCHRSQSMNVIRANTPLGIPKSTLNYDDVEFLGVVTFEQMLLDGLSERFLI
jgi:hypothetical protein